MHPGRVRHRTPSLCRVLGQPTTSLCSLPTKRGGADCRTEAPALAVDLTGENTHAMNGDRMGFSVKIAPGVRVRASSRGVRTSIGPRVARVHVGACLYPAFPPERGPWASTPLLAAPAAGRVPVAVARRSHPCSGRLLRRGRLRRLRRRRRRRSGSRLYRAVRSAVVGRGTGPGRRSASPRACSRRTSAPQVPAAGRASAGAEGVACPAIRPRSPKEGRRGCGGQAGHRAHAKGATSASSRRSPHASSRTRGKQPGRWRAPVRSRSLRRFQDAVRRTCR